MGRNALLRNEQKSEESEVFCIFEKKYFSFFANPLFVAFHKKVRMKTVTKNGEFFIFLKNRIFIFCFLPFF